MPFTLLIILFHLQIFLQLTAATTPVSPPKTLNITTLTGNAQKESVLECWQLTAPFISSADAGTSGAVFAQLGEAGKTSYGILPAKFDGGLHNAPVVQWVSFVAGEAVVSLPNSTQTATIRGGREGLILAADTKNVSALGHYTKYPGKKSTVALQIPTANGEIPEHTVLYAGPCLKKEENS